jgi:crotonobetainyl-CoA:carnitine CoA-transferase CaiB-like acyl-CoA transferase
MWSENFDLQNPFHGLKVLDLSSVLAGPLTGTFFAELGARVIKIENKLTDGDATRQWKLPKEDPDSPYSAYYFSANFGKEIMLMDLTDREERLTLEKMIEEADVVISNFQKKTASKLDLEPDTLLEKYPHLIIAQLSAYEYDDPRPGYDLVMQGETGWISMTGTDSDHLCKLPVAIVDIIAAHQLKEAILISLIHKLKNGKGNITHVSLFKSSISALANQASNYLMMGHIPKPIGTLHPNIAPYGDIFTTNDGQKVLLAIGSDAQFKKLWFSLSFGNENYHNFELNSQRLKSRSVLVSELQQKIGLVDLNHFKSLMNQNNLPFCVIDDIQAVFEQPLALQMVNTSQVDHMTARSVSNVAFSFPID